MSETNGQPSEGTPPETTPAGTEGGTNATETTPTGTQAAEETFFDPESIKGKPELESAYKQMQRAFTEKTSSLKSQKQKVEAYDAFMANPLMTIRQLATQYGMTVAEAKAVQQQASGTGEFEPKTWDDVFSRAKLEAKQEVLKELQPLFSEVKQVKQQSVEKTLDENCPDWRLYEDPMMDTLKQHPTLVNDPVKLYRLSVPDEVWQARATKEAVKKIEAKAKGASVSSGSNTSKPGNFTPSGPLSFDQAVVAAKAQLAAQGMKEPHH